jgi:hypothetical protein
MKECASFSSSPVARHAWDDVPKKRLTTKIVTSYGMMNETYKRRERISFTSLKRL